jgi:hypothetical protein
MIRDFAIALALLIAGAVGGYVYAEHSRPSRYDIVRDLSTRIEAQYPAIETEVYSDQRSGPVLYVSEKDSPDSYAGIARVEVGYDGELLVSLWNERKLFFDYHFGKPMEEDDFFAVIPRVIAQRTRKASQDQRNGP